LGNKFLNLRQGKHARVHCTQTCTPNNNNNYTTCTHSHWSNS